MLRISWTEWKANKWIRENIGIPEEKGILKQILLSIACIGNSLSTATGKVEAIRLVLATIEVK